jgi:hypothetical protein
VGSQEGEQPNAAEELAAGNPAGTWSSISAVSVFAVTDAEDIDPISVVVESDAPIADAKTELGWMNAAESLDVAGTGCG